MDRLKAQRLVLQLLGKEGLDHRFGRGRHYLAEKVVESYGGSPALTPNQVMETFWSLIAQGLAYLDMEQSAPENWALRLTGAGRAALTDEEFNPDDASGFLTSLFRRIPEMSVLVKRYVEEAVRAYNHQLYLASAVMLGVASEAAFLEMAERFATLLQGDSKAKFSAVLAEPKVSYMQKFTEFTKRVDPFRADLPGDIGETFDLDTLATLNLLRLYRNDAGHPTGRDVTREDCFLNLRVGATYLQRLYALKAHFTERASAS